MGIVAIALHSILYRPIIIILPLYAFHLWNVAFVVFFVLSIYTRECEFPHVRLYVYQKHIISLRVCICVLRPDDCESAASSFIKRIVLSARASVVVATLRRLDVGFHKRKKKTQEKKHNTTHKHIQLYTPHYKNHQHCEENQ